MNVEIRTVEKSMEIRCKSRPKKCFVKKIFITPCLKPLKKNSDVDHSN